MAIEERGLINGREARIRHEICVTEDMEYCCTVCDFKTTDKKKAEEHYNINQEKTGTRE